METNNVNQPDPKAEKDEKERKDYGTLNDPNTADRKDNKEEDDSAAQDPGKRTPESSDNNYGNIGIVGGVDLDDDEKL